MVRKISKEGVLAVCRDYVTGLSSPTIAKKHNVSSVAICGLLERRGIARRSQSLAQKKRTLREDVFDNLTDVVSYWVGFLFADGGIFKRSGSPSLTLRLSGRDRIHVEKFRCFLGSSHKIVYIPVPHYRDSWSGSKDSCQLSIRSTRLVERLEELGLVSKLKSAAILSLCQSRDFWRGVVDGDGCIGALTGRKSHLARLELVGGEPLLQQFVNYVHTVVPNTTVSVRPHKTIYKVSMSGSTARQMILTLYSNACVVLDRKGNTARNILDAGQPVQSLTYAVAQSVG